MRLLTIACDSCGRSWPAARADCVYERLAVATCPCPACGAYTLCLRDPPRPDRRRRTTLATGESPPPGRAAQPAEFAAEVENRRIAG
ncbi:MAG TPA: hypothetical protein VGF55_06650 [Gemmataceae bacterium]|jgi:hypothetical protein